MVDIRGKAIMIVLRKSVFGKNSIIFEIEREGTQDLLTAFLDCGELGQKSVKIFFKTHKREYDDELMIIKSENEFLNLSRDEKILAVDQDSINHGIFLLKSFIENGYFPVAEFCEIELMKTSQLVQIYFYASLNNSSLK